MIMDLQFLSYCYILYLLPAEFQESFGSVWNSSIRPCQEMELSDGPSFSGFQVLQIEASHQVIIAPYMFAHQMHLRS